MFTLHVANCIVHSDITSALHMKENYFTVDHSPPSSQPSLSLSLASCMEEYVIIDPLE
jgi:hypothetical protein